MKIYFSLEGKSYLSFKIWELSAKQVPLCLIIDCFPVDMKILKDEIKLDPQCAKEKKNKNLSVTHSHMFSFL